MSKQTATVIELAELRITLLKLRRAYFARLAKQRKVGDLDASLMEAICSANGTIQALDEEILRAVDG